MISEGADSAGTVVVTGAPELRKLMQLAISRLRDLTAVRRESCDVGVEDDEDKNRFRTKLGKLAEGKTKADAGDRQTCFAGVA